MALSTRIRILFFENGDFFLRFRFSFTHKRQFCAMKTVVFGPVHTYQDILKTEKFIFVFVSKKQKCASTPSVFESFFLQSTEKAKHHICANKAVMD